VQRLYCLHQFPASFVKHDVREFFVRGNYVVHHANGFSHQGRVLHVLLEAHHVAQHAHAAVLMEY
jgi:hypothetical protein